MDDGGDRGAGVEIPENADYILFAEDLVNYVMRKHFNYVSERDPIQFRALINNPFDRIIQRSIQETWSDVAHSNAHLFQNTNYYLNIITPESFTSVVNNYEEVDFKDGFNGRTFLTYCTNVSFLAACFYNNGVATAPELAKSHIVNVLKNFMPAHGWHIVRRSAEVFPIADKHSSPESTDSD